MASVKRVTSLRSRRSRAGRSSLGKRVWRVRRRGFRSGEEGVRRGFGGGDEGGGGKEAKREVRWGRVLGRREGGGGILRVLGVEGGSKGGCFL